MSAADRPRWVSEERRKAKRLVSAAAGEVDAAQQLARREDILWLPVTKSSAATLRGLPSRGQSV